MSRYKIVKITRHPYWRNNLEYLVLKRVFGFLWWWPVDDDYPYGYYSTYEEAEQRLQAEMAKDKYEIMKEC